MHYMFDFLNEFKFHKEDCFMTSYTAQYIRTLLDTRGNMLNLNCQATLVPPCTLTVVQLLKKFITFIRT